MNNEQENQNTEAQPAKPGGQQAEKLDLAKAREAAREDMPSDETDDAGSVAKMTADGSLSGF